VGSVSMEFRSQGLSSILWGVTKLLQYTEGWDLPFSTRESGGGLAVEAGYSYSWGGGCPLGGPHPRLPTGTSRRQVAQKVAGVESKRS
jgi:hypothetical protein